MALIHAKPTEVIDIRPYGPALPAAFSKALFKSEQLEVMRLILPAGKAVPQHHLAGEVTIQCLEGRVVLTAGDSELELLPGELVWLTANTPYSLLGREDASVLMTIAVGQALTA